jgi:YggT family protein
MPVITALDALIGILRPVFAGVVAVTAGAALLDWLARTRRIPPFSGLGRFIRGSITPRFTPVERRVVFAGAPHTSTPWWGLAVVVLAGVIVLTALDFVRQQVAMAVMAVDAGPRGILKVLASWTFGLLQVALVVRVLSSWVGGGRSRIVRWSMGLTEWFMAPLRNVVPTLGPIDLSPLIAYFLLSLIGGLVVRVI